jgi:hypothetical protein
MSTAPPPDRTPAPPPGGDPEIRELAREFAARHPDLLERLRRA